MVQVSIEVTATATMEEEMTSLVKEFTTSYEEEASIEIDLSGITEEEDCREPGEEDDAAVVEERAEDQAPERAAAAVESATPAIMTPNQASCFLANPVELNTCKSIADYAAMLQPSPEPSIIVSREPSLVVASVQDDSPDPEPQEAEKEPVQESDEADAPEEQLKPTITIDRRARTMPAFNVNSIANITYVDPLQCKKSVLGADLRDGCTPESTKDSSLPPVEDESVKMDDPKEEVVESVPEPKQTLASSISSKSRYVVKIAKAKSMSRGRSKKNKKGVPPTVVEKEVKTEELIEVKSEVVPEPDKVADVVVEDKVESKSQDDASQAKSLEQNSVTDKSVAEVPMEPVADAKSVANDSKTCVSVKSEDVMGDLANVKGDLASVKSESPPADEVKPEEAKSDAEAGKQTTVDALSSIPIAASKSVDSLSVHESIQHTATNTSNSVSETVEVTKAPSLESAADETRNGSSRLSRIGRSVSRARSSSTKRVKQIKSAASTSSKKLSSASRSIASNSSRRISSTSKALATSSKSALASARARSKSRVRSSKEIKTEDVAQKDSTECVPLDETAVAGDLNEYATFLADVAASKPENVSGDEEVEKSSVNAGDEQDMEAIPSEAVESKPDTVDMEATDMPAAAPANPPHVPTSPVSKTPVAGGFMGRFFSGLFCKTDDLMDFSTLCGGASAVISPVAAQTGVSLNTIQRAIESPSATNAVEVKPIFDEPEPVPEPAAEEAKFEERTPKPVCPIDPITTSLESMPSIDLQSSTLRSTKSNKSLTLITEVISQPSHESIKDATKPVAESSAEDENPAAVPEPSEVSVSFKATDKKVDLQIDTTSVSSKSISKKVDLQIETDVDKTEKEQDKKSQSSSFNLTKSLKASLKSLSPKTSSGSFMGFKRSSQAKEQPTECPSPVKIRQRQSVASTDPDLEGIRIYGGGVTVPSEDKTSYPKMSLDYSRKIGGLRGFKKQMNRRMSQVKETTKTYNKVLRHQMVKATQPKVRAIMTNHVSSGASYRKEQAANALN
ncbi:hypothetical protein ACHAWO_009152 [Cyclotella atomus]|uniref:Uncharacterized protein n=1 Tax=Cyclotella atomus TaxID=382360 RepID=A0ABD3PPF2_9STRA